MTWTDGLTHDDCCEVILNEPCNCEIGSLRAKVSELEAELANHIASTEDALDLSHKNGIREGAEAALRWSRDVLRFDIRESVEDYIQRGLSTVCGEGLRLHNDRRTLGAWENT